MSLAALLLPLLGPATQLGTVTAVQCPEDLRVRGALLTELDGRTGRDLVVVASDSGEGEDGRARVELRLHHRRSGGERAFVPEPDARLPLTPDVVAYAVGDVHPDPGAEVLLFNGRGVFAWRPGPGIPEGERVFLVDRGEVLWQTPARRSVQDWQHGLVDVDGDGLVDLLVPDARGYRLLRQVREEDGVRFELLGRPRLPRATGTWGAPPVLRGEEVDVLTGDADVAAGGDRESRGLAMAAAFLERPPLVFVVESAPAPFLRDWNADGRVDLLAQDESELLVWLQGPGGFGDDPDVRLSLPVSGRDEERGFDFSYASFATDLDADGRIDCVMLAGDKRSEDPRTQVLVFRQGATAEGEPALFGAEGRPAQVLVLAGLGGFPRLLDVDGDGLDDLVVFSFRPDLLDSLRSASTRKVEIELYVFRNQGGAFDRKPVLVAPLSVPIGGEGFRARFPGDATGDGLSELLVRDAAEHLSLRYVRAVREGWRVEDRPLWELDIDEDADLVIEDARPGVPPELLVLEKRQVLHVSFE